MKDERDSQIVIGIVVLVIGLVLLVQQFVPAHPLALGRLWPIVLVVMGVNKVIEDWRSAGRIAGGGLSLIVLGAVLLMSTQGIMDIARSWPLFIVGHGISMALGGIRRADGWNGQVGDGR